MKYEDIKKIVIASICFGFFLIITQIISMVLPYEIINENYSNINVIVIILTIFFCIVPSILYLIHLNRIIREKAVDISKIQKKEIPEVGYRQTCGAKILDDIGSFCSKCGVKII